MQTIRAQKRPSIQTKDLSCKSPGGMAKAGAVYDGQWGHYLQATKGKMTFAEWNKTYTNRRGVR